MTGEGWGVIGRDKYHEKMVMRKSEKIGIITFFVGATQCHDERRSKYEHRTMNSRQFYDGHSLLV